MIKSEVQSEAQSARGQSGQVRGQVRGPVNQRSARDPVRILLRSPGRKQAIHPPRFNHKHSHSALHSAKAPQSSQGPLRPSIRSRGRLPVVMLRRVPKAQANETNHKQKNNKQTIKQLSQAGKETVNLYRVVQIDSPTWKNNDANSTEIGDGCSNSTRPPPADTMRPIGKHHGAGS